MTNHIVLFEPLFPANTGNIARTAAATNFVLDLIEPLGFDIDEKSIKRAGLDYWDKVNINVHKNLPEFLDIIDTNNLLLVSKYSEKNYVEVDFSDTDRDYYLMFGKETTGLPEVFERKFENQTIRIPQNDKNVRSLNLSNSVAIVAYELLRQQSFEGLNLTQKYQQDKLK